MTKKSDPLLGFLPPGSVTLSNGALDLIKTTHEKAMPNDCGRLYPIIVIRWADSRRMRVPQTNQWRDLGEGPCLTGIDEPDVPKGAVVQWGDIRFAVKIPRSHLIRYFQPMLDCIEDFPYALRLCEAPIEPSTSASNENHQN
jgi:hypothetical protein